MSTEGTPKVDPLEQRPREETGDTAVPREGDVAQAPQTVDEDFRPPS
ncbi:MAG TPA: hypothetical protein VK665_19120 [Candidatus Elarobacter sp.]|nr:hypothetical protein [Candidatus Elarobacter sp.]